MGGHLLSGCVVRTTVEIVLGLAYEVRSTRPVDAETGHAELSFGRDDGAGGPEGLARR